MLVNVDGLFRSIEPGENIRNLSINSGPFSLSEAEPDGAGLQLPFCWPCMRAEEGENLWWIWRQHCRSLQHHHRQQTRWQQSPLNLILHFTGLTHCPNSWHSTQHWNCNLKGAWEHELTSEFARLCSVLLCSDQWTWWWIGTPSIHWVVSSNPVSLSTTTLVMSISRLTILCVCLIHG